MSKRSNPTVIGAFVVGAIAIAVAGALLLGGRAWFSRPQTFVMFFDGSVAGLEMGAPVKFRGIPLGTVTDIRQVAGASQIAVFAGIEVERQRVLGDTGRFSSERLRKTVSEAIERGLRAQLQAQSLVTGQLYVALDLFPDIPVRMLGLDKSVPEIPTVPTTVQQASEQIKRIIARLEALPLEQLLASVTGAVEALRTLGQSPELKQTLQGAARAVGEVDSVLRKVDAEIGPLAASARGALDEARSTVGALKVDLTRVIDRLDRQIGALGTSANETLGDTRSLIAETRQVVRQTGEQLTPLLTSATRTSDAARAALERAQGTLDHADGLLTEDSPLGAQLGQALEEVADAARSLRSLTDFLERQPSSVVWGRRAGGGR